MIKIIAQKANISPEELCESLPEQFVTYLKYCKTDYEYIRNLFKSLAMDRDIKHDFHFDWVKLGHSYSIGGIQILDFDLHLTNLL